MHSPEQQKASVNGSKFTIKYIHNQIYLDIMQLNHSDENSYIK